MIFSKNIYAEVSFSYEVKAGDSIGKILLSMGFSPLWGEENAVLKLKKDNSIADPDLIYPGQKIVFDSIPPWLCNIDVLENSGIDTIHKIQSYEEYLQRREKLQCDESEVLKQLKANQKKAFTMADNDVYMSLSEDLEPTQNVSKQEENSYSLLDYFKSYRDWKYRHSFGLGGAFTILNQSDDSISYKSGELSLPLMDYRLEITDRNEEYNFSINYSYQNTKLASSINADQNDFKWKILKFKIQGGEKSFFNVSKLSYKQQLALEFHDLIHIEPQSISVASISSEDKHTYLGYGIDFKYSLTESSFIAYDFLLLYLIQNSSNDSDFSLSSSLSLYGDLKYQKLLNQNWSWGMRWGGYYLNNGFSNSHSLETNASGSQSFLTTRFLLYFEYK